MLCCIATYGCMLCCIAACGYILCYCIAARKLYFTSLSSFSVISFAASTSTSFFSMPRKI